MSQTKPDHEAENPLQENYYEIHVKGNHPARTHRAGTTRRRRHAQGTQRRRLAARDPAKILSEVTVQSVWAIDQRVSCESCTGPALHFRSTAWPCPGDTDEESPAPRVTGPDRGRETEAPIGYGPAHAAES